MEIIKFTRLRDNAIIPTKGSKEAAGFDLYACLDTPVTINPGETRLIGTGLAFELPKNTFAGIFARSGLATKKGLAHANKVGVCDSDYRGQYLVGLHTHSSAPATVHHVVRIAQMVIIPYLEVTLTEDDLSDTDSGLGGFGSTGV